jgi:hypothetical protein
MLAQAVPVPPNLEMDKGCLVLMMGALQPWRAGFVCHHAHEGEAIGIYRARLTPHTMGGPAHTMWMNSCGQLIEPGHRGGVCR